jgi:hypothetical protein
VKAAREGIIYTEGFGTGSYIRLEGGRSRKKCEQLQKIERLIMFQANVLSMVDLSLETNNDHGRGA